MTKNQLKRIQDLILYFGTIMVFGANIVNYFYAYQQLNDRILQWRIAMISIAWVLFVWSVYIWIQQLINNSKIKQVLSGWVALYLLINLTGVVLGYNLHTKGFMAILFVTTLGAVSHIMVRLWRY